MAAIHDLLNPLPVEDTVQADVSARSPELKVDTNTLRSLADLPIRKKQKLCKDAAIFVRGPVRGNCRYPPHEFQDETLAAQHELFQLYPIGEIGEYPRHIPYNSDKKSFWEKTGRECLEVFQYQFKVPGDDTTYTMLWDYNIGLVRTTPLFKCVGYSKTTPAKMLNRNAGLRDICHSITGGALVAQGYWMPYEAARAVAATFCYNIRHALTPVFGVDFPDLCVHPDSASYGEMLIDSAITKRCTQQARAYKEMEEHVSSRASSTIASPKTPVTPNFQRHLKQIRPKLCRIPSEAGYSSDESHSDNYILSPEVACSSFQNKWTAANTPRSFPRTQNTLQSPMSMAFERPVKKLKRAREDSNSSSETSDYPRESQRLSSKPPGKGECTDDSDDESNSEDEAIPTRHNQNTRPLLNDEKAAYLLMGLRIQHGQKNEEILSFKRRASA